MFSVVLRPNLLAINRLLINYHNTNNPLKNENRLYATAAQPVKPVSVSSAQPIGKRRFRRPVETDVHKIVNNCMGANYLVDGQHIKLKDDSEYPDWLWNLPLSPPRVHELDPNTKEYWEALHTYGLHRSWKERKFHKKRQMIVKDYYKLMEELKYRRRFRALTKKEGFDAGYEVIKHIDREDFKYAARKEELRLPDDPRPFYPGIDQLNLPNHISRSFIRLRKNDKLAGRFGW